MGSEVVVSLRSKRHRRQLALQKLNHVIPAAGLLFAGMQAIREGHHGVGFYLGVFELVSSAALIILFIRELRASRVQKHPTSASARADRSAGSGETSPKPLRGEGGHHAHPAHHGVDWVDIAAGFVLTAEVFEHWHETHHWPRPIIVSAITTFALGILHGRLSRWKATRRVLRVNDRGLQIAGRLFKARRLHATWEQLRSIDVGPRWAVVTTRGGRSRKIDLSDLVEGDRIRAALLEAQARLSEDPAAAGR